jgi:hypothetical protein
MRSEQAIAALRWAPLLPWWIMAAIAAVCLAAVAVAVFRRARGAVWRAVAFALLIAWLSGPRLVREARDVMPDIGLLALDESGSMALGNRAALRDQARDAMTRQAAHMPGLELRTVTVPPGSGTPLFAAIARAAAGIPQGRLAGIVAVTDGQATDTPAQPLPAPLHALITAKGEEVDRRLRVVQAPSFGVVGKSAVIRYRVEDLGADRADATATVTVRRDDEPPHRLTVPVGRDEQIEIPITRAGPTLLELQAAALPGEVSDINNRAVVEINGVRDRLRVLLVSGEPNPGERAWRRLLKSDPAVDLVHFTILRPPEKNDNTPLDELALIAFPTHELFQVKLHDFDLVILDRFQNRGLLPPSYLRNIADYVRGGGGLLLEAGPEFAVVATTLAATPLATVLPVQPSSVVDGAFRPQVTETGQRHPVTEDLPGGQAGTAPSWGPWYRYIAAGSPTGQVLLDTPDGSPLLLLDRVGEGRVAMLLSDQIWLWSRGHDGGGPQGELLRRIAHWLMKEPALEEEALRAHVEAGQLVVEKRSLSNAPPGDVTVSAPDGKTSRLALQPSAPGLSRGTVAAAQPGVWRVSDGVHTAFAAATLGDAAEYADLRATAQRLAQPARASGGSVSFIGDTIPELRRTQPGRATSGNGWISLPRRDDYVVTGVDATPLLPAWAALPLLLGAIVLAWRREGHG